MRNIISNDDYTLVFEEIESHYANFKAYEVDSITNEEIPIIFYRKSDGINETTDIKEAKHFCSGMIKWDGCMDIDLNTHYCGYNNELQNLIKDIYTLASETITSFDSDLANFKIKANDKNN